MARVLIVDDDPQFRRVIRVALTVRGYEVSEAANGSQALDEMRGGSIDVVLLDWRMPVMDGEATCHAIRASADLPIIVVTASDRVQEASTVRQERLSQVHTTQSGVLERSTPARW